MVFNSPEEKRLYIRRMFGRIAGRYDLLNRLMTAGQDLRLRREAVRSLELPAGALVLDVGAGTGDLAVEAGRQAGQARLVACDLTLEMMQVGKKRPGGQQIHWVLADAAHLPFAGGTFDGVVSGYLLRNVPEVQAVLEEQQRVLVSGGHMAALDTTPPQKNVFYPFVQIHLRYIIPLLGRLVGGDAEAYRYLPDSTERFLKAEPLAELLRQAGFVEVSFVRRLFGSMAIHRGRKA